MNVVRNAAIGLIAWGVAASVAVAQSPEAQAPETQAPEKQAPEAQSDQADAGRRLMAVIDAVIEHHFDPPTRQQLVLEALRRAAAQNNRDLPPGLSRKISSAPPDSLTEIMVQQLGRIAASDDRNKKSVQAVALPLSQLLPDGVYVMSADQHRVAAQLQANRYVGIGIRLSRLKDQRFHSMANVLPGGPTARAGAKDGDIITEVDGRDVAGLSTTDLIDLLRGPKGSAVEVVVKQPGEQASRTYKLTRDVVPIASLGAPGFSSDRRAVGIRIRQVSASTVHELRKVESQLGDRTELVVLDVRFLEDHNLHNGRLLANALIDGAVVGAIETTNGTQHFSAEPGRLFSGRKLVLLIGPGTAGTIEWISAALQDQKQATLIGVPTAAAGNVRETVPTSCPDLMIGLPVGRLRRGNGKGLLAATDVSRHGGAPTGILDMFVVQARSKKTVAGVSPDIADSVWQRLATVRGSTQEIEKVTERVAGMILDKDTATTTEPGE